MEEEENFNEDIVVPEAILMKQHTVMHLFKSAELMAEASSKMMLGNGVSYERCMREASKHILWIYNIYRPKFTKIDKNKEIFKKVENFILNGYNSELNLTPIEWIKLHNELADVLETLHVTDIKISKKRLNPKSALIDGL